MINFPKNCRISLVAPAGKISKEDAFSGADVLKKCGCEVNFMPNVFSGSCLPFLSAEDSQRAEDINNCLADERCSIIWCVRGGYGSARILDMLDWETFKKKQPTVAGFSDITALHWAMASFGIDSRLAAPSMKFLSENRSDLTWDTLSDALADKPVSLKLDALRIGEANGKVLPGNIAVASSLCGTRYFPDTSGLILLLEEVGEAPYRIDRMLTQMRLAGAFDNCLSVIFGRFTDCGTAEEIRAVLENFTAQVSCPVFTGFPYGHELPFFSISGRQEFTISPK